MTLHFLFILFFCAKLLIVAQILNVQKHSKPGIILWLSGKFVPIFTKNSNAAH